MLRRLSSLARICLLSALACGVSGNASGQPLPLWEISGQENTVYLLGSIHLLREPDYPLPDRVYAAYEDAEQLVMELDMDDLDPSRLQAVVAELGIVSQGSSLETMLGAEHFERASELAAAAELDLEGFSNLEPWLVAVTVEQVLLQRIGFDPGLGVESHFAERAAADGKDIAGLETIEQQLGYLDSLSPSAQRELLLETLEVAGDIAETMDELVKAWQRGDTAYLEKNLLDDMRAHPEIHKAIVLDRNRQWVKRILERLDDREDYLVIVGTLHLVGDDGVPALLRHSGQSVRQLSR